jgi:hypothetical protein
MADQFAGHLVAAGRDGEEHRCEFRKAVFDD